MARIGADEIDNTQRNIYNTRMTGYTLSNYFSDSTSNDHVRFATEYPNMMYSAVNGGTSVNSSLIDIDSMLLVKKSNDSSLEKLSLEQRPFLTVPYLGRGSCDPLLETQMLQGETTQGLKSTSTIMDKSFMNYALYPMDQHMERHVADAKYTVEEAAMDGWVRGGVASREWMNDQDFSQNVRPNTRF